MVGNKNIFSGKSGSLVNHVWSAPSLIGKALRAGGKITGKTYRGAILGTALGIAGASIGVKAVKKTSALVGNTTQRVATKVQNIGQDEQTKALNNEISNAAVQDRNNWASQDGKIVSKAKDITKYTATRVKTNVKNHATAVTHTVKKSINTAKTTIKNAGNIKDHHKSSNEYRAKREDYRAKKNKAYTAKSETNYDPTKTRKDKKSPKEEK